MDVSQVQKNYFGLIKQKEVKIIPYQTNKKENKNILLEPRVKFKERIREKVLLGGGIFKK